MLVYFSSRYPSVVKLGGAVLGRADTSAKPVRIEKGTFVEFCPLDGGTGCAFIMDDEFFTRPPTFISLTDLKGGYLVRAFNPQVNQAFTTLSQEKFSDALITVFCDGALKLSLQTENGFLCDSFPFYSDTVEITRFKTAVLIFFPKVNTLFVYDLKTLKKLREINCDSFSVAENLTTSLKKTDLAKHLIKKTWDLADGELNLLDKTVTESKDFDRKNLPESLLPYAFAEEVSVGGDFEYYLSDELKGKKDDVEKYLGKFIAVMPPPCFRKNGEVGLIYKKSFNVYSVDYMTVEVKDGKIDNIKRSEN